jgi:hypothetical protein
MSLKNWSLLEGIWESKENEENLQFGRVDQGIGNEREGTAAKKRVNNRVVVETSRFTLTCREALPFS